MFDKLVKTKENPLTNGLIAGGLAGLINCIVVTPVELVKCRLQMQYCGKEKAYYKGLLDCIVKIIEDEGNRSIYRGNLVTICREIPAYAAQFGAYSLAKQKLAKFQGIQESDLGYISLTVCGSVGGYFCWQFSYPQVWL